MILYVLTQHDVYNAVILWWRVLTQHDAIQTCSRSSLLLGAELIITHEPARCQHFYTDAHVRTMNDPLGKRSDRGVKHCSDTRWPQPSWACDINTTRRSSDRRKSEKKGSKIPSMYFSDKKVKTKLTSNCPPLQNQIQTSEKHPANADARDFQPELR